MREEVSLHAGIAVVNMVRDVFSPDFRETGPSRRSLRLIEVAICKLRQHIEKSVDGYISDDASIVAAMFLGHMAVSLRLFPLFETVGGLTVPTECFRRLRSIPHASSRY